MSLENIFVPNALETFFDREYAKVKAIDAGGLASIGSIILYTDKGRVKVKLNKIYPEPYNYRNWEEKWVVYVNKKKGKYTNFKKSPELTEKLEQYLSKLEITKEESIPQVNYSYGEYTIDYKYKEINIFDKEKRVNVKAKVEGKGEYRYSFYQNDYDDEMREEENKSGIFEREIGGNSPEERIEAIAGIVQDNADLVKYRSEYTVERQWKEPAFSLSKGWVWKGETYSVREEQNGKGKGKEFSKMGTLLNYLEKKGFDRRLAEFILELKLNNKSVPEDLQHYEKALIETMEKSPILRSFLTFNGLNDDLKVEIWKVMVDRNDIRVSSVIGTADIYIVKGKNDKILQIDYYFLGQAGEHFRDLVENTTKVGYAKYQNRLYVILTKRDGDNVVFRVLTKRRPTTGVEKWDAQLALSGYIGELVEGEYTPPIEYSLSEFKKIYQDYSFSPSP